MQDVLIIRNKPVLCGYLSKKEPMRKAMDTSLISNSQKIKELILTFNHSSRKTQRTEQRTYPKPTILCHTLQENAIFLTQKATVNYARVR
jgi:hypothetical protein